MNFVFMFMFSKILAPYVKRETGKAEKLKHRRCHRPRMPPQMTPPGTCKYEYFILMFPGARSRPAFRPINLVSPSESLIIARINLPHGRIIRQSGRDSKRGLGKIRFSYWHIELRAAAEVSDEHLARRDTKSQSLIMWTQKTANHGLLMEGVNFCLISYRHRYWDGVDHCAFRSSCRF